MTARRFSSLPMAEVCGPSAALSKASKWRMREGQIGRAFHLWFEHKYGSVGNDEAKAKYDEMLVSMLEEDRETVGELTSDTLLRFVPPWKPGTALEMELELAINEYREPVAYDSPDAIARGKLDVGWIENRGPENTPTAIIVDHKTGHWVDVRKHMLQLAGYAIAYARLREVRHVVMYVHLVRESKVICVKADETADGEGIYMLDLDGPEGSALWQRVLVAAMNVDTEYVVGSHCSDCFERMHCPARMLPASALLEKMAAMKAGEDAEHDQVRDMLVAADALADTAKNAKEFAQAWVRARGNITDGGRVYAASESKGRRTAQVDELLAAGLDKYVKDGAPGIRFGWKNIGGRRK